MYDFQITKCLNDEDLNLCFEFMKNYLVEIYGKEALSDENFQVWKKNREKINENKFFFKMLKNDDVFGFAEILTRSDNTLYFSDIIVREDKRRTRIVYEFIKYLLDLEEFKNYKEIHLHINKKNKTSLNAWKCFNLSLLEEGEKSNKYKIERKDVEQFML